MGSDAAGDVLYYSGTDYVKLAKGNNKHCFWKYFTIALEFQNFKLAQEWNYAMQK